MSWVPREAGTWNTATKIVFTIISSEITTVGASVWPATHSGTPTVCTPKLIASTADMATAPR